MKIREKTRTNLMDGDSITIYECINLNDENELLNLLIFVEQQYGEIEKIKCLKFENDEVICFSNYSSLNQFRNKKVILDMIDTISFSCKNKNINFLLNCKTKEIIVTDLSNTLGPRDSSKPKIKYYEDEYHNIIKHDEIEDIYYTLNSDGNWAIEPNLNYKFEDLSYTFIPVDYVEDDSTLKKNITL